MHNDMSFLNSCFWYHDQYTAIFIKLCVVFNTQSVERIETLRGKLRKEHAEKEDQLKEKLAERDHLREKLAEKDRHINSYLKEISDLRQHLKVTSFIV